MLKEKPAMINFRGDFKDIVMHLSRGGYGRSIESRSDGGFADVMFFDKRAEVQT